MVESAYWLFSLMFPSLFSKATKSMASEVDAPKPSDYSLSTSNCEDDRVWMGGLGFIWRKFPHELQWDIMG